MAARSEPQSAALENDARRRENSSGSTTPEPLSEHEDGLVGRIFSGAPGEPSAEGAARLLGSSTFSYSANSGPRAISLKRAQQTHGNHFAQRVVRGIQRKPATPRIVQRECACGGTCEKCRATDTTLSAVEPSSNPDSSFRLVQGQATSANALNAPEPEENEIIPSESPGQSLDEQTRHFMESGFGTDFKDVLIHTDSHAAASAKALGANAYTSGRDIYFSAGKYAPESDEGKRLLAHELVHTIQQRANTPSFARQSASTSDLIIDPDDSLEQDADRVAKQIVAPVGAVQKDFGQDLSRVHTDGKVARSARAIQSKTGSDPIGFRIVSPSGFGLAPIQRAAGNMAIQPVARAIGGLEPDPSATGQDTFNPGSIVNDLRRAIDQSDVTLAGIEPADTTWGPVKYKYHREVNFDAVYKALNNLSSAQIKTVRDLYAAKEAGRTLDHDLFDQGESGYPSNLTVNQRSRLQVLLRGTKGDALGPEISAYLKWFRPEMAARLQSLLVESKLPAVRLNQLERTALEIVHILSDDLDGSKRERLMALHRRPVEEISIIDAFYESHTGVNLPTELGRKLEGLQQSRMYQLRSGNAALADAFAIEDKRRTIEELDRAREANPISEGALDFFAPGTGSSLEKQRQALVGEIDEIVAMNRQEAMNAAEGTMTTAAQAVAERLKNVLGQGRDDAGRNVGDLLKVTLGEKKAAELTAITSGALIEAHAQRLAETESRKKTNSEQILATIRELRAEATHDVVARAADPWLSLAEKQKLLDRVDEEVQLQASKYVAQFQSAYESVRGEGRPWADIVASFKSVDEDEVNRMARGAGTLTDEEEIDLAIRRGKPDLAIAVLKRQPTQEAVHLLRVKYLWLTGKWLEASLYGYGYNRAATADEAADPSSKYFGVTGGVATGRDAVLAAEQLEKPAAKDRGGVVEMEWVAASAEREFEVTWENRGLTGRLREIGDDPETETIMRESIKEVRALKKRWIDSTDDHEKRRILFEMKRWRATLTGDAAAYEADNKKMLDKIRSAVSIAVQLALAIALPGAGATFVSFVRMTAINIATSVASNVVIYGEDYSLDRLRGDIVGGVLGAAGGKLGEELVGVALAAKEARAVAGEIAERIAKPVADATAGAAAKVGIGTTIAKEAASQLGSTAGLTLATGENQFTFQTFFEGALMSGATMLGKKVFGVDAPTSATEPHMRVGGKQEEPTAVAHPTERETPAARAGDEPASVTHDQEHGAPTAQVPHEPGTTKPPTGGAGLDASVERSSHQDTITDQQAANEVAYIDKHPELPVEGTPPNQHVKLGDHEIVEVPGGGCERHSPGGRPLGACPITFGVNKHAKEIESRMETIPAELRGPTAETLKKVRDIVRKDPAKAQRVLDELETRLPSEEVGSVPDKETRRMLEGADPSFDPKGDLVGMNVTAPLVRRPPAPPKVPKPLSEVPLSTMAEQQLRAPLEQAFPGGTWQEQQRFKAPLATKGETLGSTIPEYFRPAPPENMSFEVKRWDLEELGISPTGTSHTKPSASSVEPLRRAREQLEVRRENLPEGTTQCIVFNITGKAPGVTDLAALGGQLRQVMLEHNIRYDRVFLQDGDQLIPIN